MESLEKVTDENFVPSDRKKKVGSYILGRTIGEGSFAKVRQGFHIIAKEKVAVKVVSKKALSMKEYVRRNVRREAIVLQKIHHPNIVRMYEVMETENGYYLVLEFIEGGEFIKYLCMKKFLPEFECRKFARQLVSAVDHLHRSNIVHRDLKLENFMLDKELNLKIIEGKSKFKKSYWFTVKRTPSSIIQQATRRIRMSRPNTQKMRYSEYVELLLKKKKLVKRNLSHFIKTSQS